MQLRPPPMNVIVPPHTPGIFTSWLPARPLTHRSGLNSSASSPHISGLWFAFAIATHTGVPLGTGIAVSTVPSVAVRGVPSGRIAGARVSLTTEGATGGYLIQNEFFSCTAGAREEEHAQAECFAQN